jgi:hypothetical protein
VPRNLARLRHCDRIGEQPSAPIAIVTNTFGNAGEPRERSRFKRVLQQNGAIKTLRSQFAGQAQFRSPIPQPTRRVIVNHAIDRRFTRVNIRYPGTSEHNDFRVRKCVSDRSKSRLAT